MQQITLSAAIDSYSIRPKTTRKQVFLAQMDTVIPWQALIRTITPHYPIAGNGRRPYPLPTMLRIHLLQHWFGYSDPAMEEALHDIPLLRAFASIDLGTHTIPDETTIMNFRHLLDAHHVSDSLFAVIAQTLHTAGLLVMQGTIVDATLVAAPPSTKNKSRKRDPDMSSTRKNKQYHFGIKAHIGVDMDSGLVHSVEVTTAKVHDSQVIEQLLHGDEAVVSGDKAYSRKNRHIHSTPQDEREAGLPLWLMPHKKGRGQQLTWQQREENRQIAFFRSKVEHVFRVMKRQFGYVKVRYRGLVKNTQHVIRMMMLSNLYLARGRLLALAG